MSRSASLSAALWCQWGGEAWHHRTLLSPRWQLSFELRPLLSTGAPPSKPSTTQPSSSLKMTLVTTNDSVPRLLQTLLGVLKAIAVKVLRKMPTKSSAPRAAAQQARRPEPGAFAGVGAPDSVLGQRPRAFGFLLFPPFRAGVLVTLGFPEQPHEKVQIPRIRKWDQEEKECWLCP